ncbi:MAG: hypothetical protein KatS3mg102_2977 [Planctomycetota bacterium]|nr:MAG: hypothetical protein KatS3mg102_2977 [Planctomycetota bacterium]
MDLYGKRCLLLGGAGQVGQAVARRLLERRPARVVIGALSAEEAEEACAALRPHVPEGTELSTVVGNVFLRTEHKDASPQEILRSTAIQEAMIEDVLGRMDETILEGSFLYEVFREHRPELVVDAINTATAVAYQNIYRSGAELRELIRRGDSQALRDAVLRLLATLSVPQLIRHVQLLWECMLRAGTRMYVKIGTSGTGGMGLNIPYTHGEERPSRVLLSKSALAGAHTMLLFLAARTPGGPVVKELKPSALIAWKAIRFGEIRVRRRPVALVDCPPAQAVVLEDGMTFEYARHARGRPVGEVLRAPYVDTGENGVFSAEEFKAITMLNQMEYITPEEIAEATLWEIEGRNTGADVVVALDGAILGPTYRAGALREEALARLEALAAQHPEHPGIAFEILGPPRLSKLLFEAYLLKRELRTLHAVATAEPAAMSAALEHRVCAEPQLRQLALSVGIPILLADGRRLLCARREIADKEWETTPWRTSPETIDRLSERQWIDLRPQNMARWQRRAATVLALLQASRPEAGSFETTDLQAQRWPRDAAGEPLVDPGHLAGWIFSEEDRGRRMKR